MKKLLLLFVISGFLFISCNEEKQDNEQSLKDASSQDADTELFQKAKQIFGALPDKMPGSENDTPELVELGKMLYFDTRLSVNGTQSCNTCHNIVDSFSGVDNKRVSPGAIEGKEGTRNSPTVLNAGYHFVQFWDGREPDLKAQAKGPILNPVEMAMPDEKAVEKKISAVKEYKEMFAKAYPNDKNTITYDNIANAIAAFERTLISKSRFDDYMNGDQNALNENEIRGMKVFIETGCTTCHISPLLGGSMYQKMGLVKPYGNSNDFGRFDATKNEADKFFFKVPSLRNIAYTNPYFHDGTVNSLEEAIKIMADINLGKTLTDVEVSDIKTFLNCLTDKDFEQGNPKKYQ